MTDTDIRHALTRATDDVSASPELLDRVRAGGRRRVVRRRTVLTGGLAVAAVGVAVPLAAGRSDEQAVRAAARGDLAGDRALVGRALTAWRQVHGAGAAYVHWIGSTPAGPVAVVAQPDPPTGLDRVGFVEPVGDTLRALAGFALRPPGTVETSAALVGRDRDVLVVVTGGRPLWFSADYEFDAIGRVSREYEEVAPPADGVLVRRVRPPHGSVRFALMQDGPDTRVPLANLDAVVDTGAAVDRIPERVDRPLPGRERAWPADAALTRAELDQWDVATRARYTDPAGYHLWTGPTEWYLRGAAADGRRLVVQTLALDGRARAFLIVGAEGDTPPAEYLGPLDDGLSTDATDGAGEPLPILHARLPLGLGVAVAVLAGKLRYRVRGGSWLPVAGSAAVLPAAATELEVTPRRGAAVRVGLP